MADQLTPDELAHRLMEVFSEVGILHRRVYRKIEQDALPSGLSVGVRAILALLVEHGPMTVPQLGRAQALSRQFVQRMVNDAIGSELVETHHNPEHKRSALVVSTEKGRAAMAMTTAREHALLRAVGGNLTDADIDTCLRVLRRLREPFDQVDMDDRPTQH
ncbi:MarR family winged helix-turn-helix transcriptional regulator [Nocardia sp. NPDC059180]|uniref:MarR family winged helix-turn-helix transcriptional regulator n=1 Tax=Nocardia sp. NPDC059180 TaxID=3346761 RepID=UPI0036B7C0D3